MNSGSIGDLAQSFTMRQRNATLKQDMLRLTEELSTGQVKDVRSVLAGNYSYLTDLERKLDVLGGYNVATTEATLLTGAMQTALERMQEIGNDLANSLLIAGSSSVGAAATDTPDEAYNALEALIGSLNSKMSGRSLFGGTATDRPPLSPTEDVLAALRTAMAGATTPTDMITAATAWFDDPAGFAAAVYQGADEALVPFSLSDNENVALDVRVVDPQLKDLLRDVALSALADDPAFGLSTPQQAELFFATGSSMLGARDGVISIRSRVGFAEARIDAISARNAAETTSIEFARGALLGVDPYETATKLEEVQFQLQSLYAVTVRMSQLSLVNFL